MKILPLSDAPVEVVLAMAEVRKNWPTCTQLRIRPGYIRVYETAHDSNLSMEHTLIYPLDAKIIRAADVIIDKMDQSILYKVNP